jgi:hypothetical protein
MMSTDRFDRELGIALGDLADPQVPDYLTDILRQTADLRQRPAWASIERWLPMEITTRPILRPSLPWRQLAFIAALIALVVAGLAIYAGTHQTRLPAPFGPAANGLIPFVSNGDIYLGDPATGQTRPLVTSSAVEGGPLTSPDGTRVAFAREVPETTLTDVFVVRIDGSDLHRITPAPIDRLISGTWAPAGDRFAMLHEVGDPVAGCSTMECRLTRLDIVDTAGAGALETIASGVGMNDVLFRPPDGRELAYRALVDGKWSLFAMTPDGRNEHPIVAPTADAQMDFTFIHLAYSPDGRRLYFNQTTSDASNGDPGCCQLFAVDADGGTPYKFVHSEAGVWDGDPVASPDGRWARSGTTFRTSRPTRSPWSPPTVRVRSS